MIENLIGKRYADALSSSIKEDSLLNPTLASLKGFQGAFEAQPQLSRFFAHPSIPLEKKNSMVNALAQKLNVGNAVLSLLLILSERKKILYVGNIAEYFEKIVDRRLNQVRASVQSANPLTSQNIERLRSALSKILGKNVLIDTEVDESLIGGIQLRVGDQVADATIKNRLAMLKQKLAKEEVA